MDEYDRSQVECKTENMFSEFVERIYDNEALPPFSYRFQFADPKDFPKLGRLLGHFILRGSKILFDKEPAKLSLIQIGKLREYLLSIGYDCDYSAPDIDEQNGKTHYHIQFKFADPALKVNHNTT